VLGETGLDGEARYKYNANNFLVEYTSAEGRSTRYGYDGLNRRVYKAEGKNVLESYLYDGLDVLLELAGPKGQHATTYYRANGRIVTQQKFSAAGNNGGYRHRPEGRRLYYTYDGLGSVASLSNHKGKSKTRYQYTAFGELVAGDTSNNQYTFTGKRLDTETGFYHFHFRKYDASTGVWTTADPIGILDGVNVYSYVKNNSINQKDWRGLCGEISTETEDAYEMSFQAIAFGIGVEGYNLGRTGIWKDVLDPGTGVAKALEHGMPFGHNFAKFHDEVVDVLTKVGVPDILANVPTMPLAYAFATIVTLGLMGLEAVGLYDNLYDFEPGGGGLENLGSLGPDDTDFDEFFRIRR